MSRVYERVSVRERGRERERPSAKVGRYGPTLADISQRWPISANVTFHVFSTFSCWWVPHFVAESAGSSGSASSVSWLPTNHMTTKKSKPSTLSTAEQAFVNQFKPPVAKIADKTRKIAVRWVKLSTFGEDQQRSFGDYLELAMQSQYNKRNV